ncbi:ninjurin-2-like isoform X6 [Cylas formicarius]|uniref:ninjurin-2-like isoform X6 n=1 Tax=Cylas formicarius TaxID=197179 RepID=UPI002958A7A4|nr:ninjurin-2-like isoform X6 [Cylas formicarius]
MSVSPSNTGRNKTLDVNKYATKKTIAQGLLDVALLTANASQLKYVLQVGEKHEFYTLMLTLITISIILQVTAGLLSVMIAVLRTHQDESSKMLAWILNHISLAFVTGTLFCDVVKMNFGLDPAIASDVFYNLTRDKRKMSNP